MNLPRKLSWSVSLMIVSLSLAIALSPLLVFGEEMKSIGAAGQDGENGSNGREGKNREGITIFADGSSMNLNLSGEDGFRGEDGSNGKNAVCTEQPVEPEYDINLADGGNGGNGGDGGNGGNGGSLTIYTNNAANLRQIYVVASGGKGGQSGNGGNGGNGCQCTQPFWSLEFCTGKPGSSDYRCTTREFMCKNGDNGRNGSPGRPGRDGNLGSLTLINRTQPLTSDRLSASVSMSELKERGFTLSKNEWATRDGATSLFAPNSVIADQYLELVERKENSVLLVWNAPQPFADFADKLITLALKDDETVDVTLPKDVWFDGTTVKQPNFTQLFVFNAVLENQVTRLKSNGLSGNSIDLQLYLEDEAKRSDAIATQFSIKYRITTSDEVNYRRVYDYKTVYEGEINPALINYNNNQFIINIGRLPLEAQYLEPGIGVEIELLAKRSFAGQNREQKIFIRDIIKR